MMAMGKARPTGNGEAMRRRFQVGHVFKRGKREKVWVGCYRDWERRDGRLQRVQRQRVLGLCADMTKVQAKEALRDVLMSIGGRQRAPEQSMSFGQFEAKWEAGILLHYRDSTRGFYKRTITRWILPYFEDWKLSDIKTPDLQMFMNTFTGYSRSVIKHVRASLSVLMSTAVDWQYVPHNPVEGVKLPPGKAVKRAPVLSPEQVGLLVSNLEEPYRTMVVVAASTGMRESEVLALRWDDVDKAAKTIAVRRSLYKGKLDRPKTEESERVIPFGQAVSDALKRLQSSKRATGDYLFVTACGNLFTGQQVTKMVFRPLANSLGLPPFTWRSFRRSAETAMHTSDVPLKVQQQILGHSSPNMTLLYADPGIDAKRQATEGLSDLMFANVVKSKPSARPN
jgi:integrase